MSFAVVDTVLTGHASAVDLATLGLGLSVYSTVFVGLMGAVSALNPVIAQHFGANRHAAIGASYGQGLWMALLLSGGGVLLFAFPEAWLPWLHPPPEVVPFVARYLRVLSLALPASLMFRAIYSLNTAVSRPHVVMAMQLGGLVLKVLLSYALIFGALGLPRLGAVGGALASVITFWALFLAGLTYMRLDPFYRRFAIHWTWPQWLILRELLHLATSFTVITLLAARLGTTVMGGHQVVANLAALCFMIPLSLSVATATLTAQAFGAGDPARARETAATGMRIGVVVAVTTVLMVWTLRHGIVRLYTSEPAVAAMALSLIPYLAAFHVFDAIQTVAGFVLRAHKVVIPPTVIYAVALWGVGVFGGYHLAFRGMGGPRGASPGCG
jgi:MATE family multidrug resistance protein